MAAHFRFSHRVTYADCTLGNHVYYGRFLELLEAARGEFFRSINQGFGKLQAADYIFPVIECHLHYEAAARYDDVLEVQIQMLQAKGVRLTFKYSILNQSARSILRAETAHVCTSLDNKPKRLPPDLVQALLPFLIESVGS